MSFAQLGFPPWPGLIDVEECAYWVDDNGLTAIVVLEEEESTIVGTDVPIHTPRHKGFTRRLPKRFLKMDCARKIHAELPLRVCGPINTPLASRQPRRGSAKLPQVAAAIPGVWLYRLNICL